MKNTMRLFCLAALIVIMNLPGAVQACTLWAAAGESVDGGGTILCKNRDWRPDNKQQLRILNQGGYRFLSLYATGNDTPGTKAGVNEKGFAIVSASAPSVTTEPVMDKATIGKLLSRYDSVDSAIKALLDGQWRCGPEFLVMADGKETACIEFGPGDRYAVVSRITSGVLFHTNHYLADDLLEFNQGKSPSSHIRYDKIKALLASKEKFSVEDFKGYSRDPALWRQGETPASTRTLSSWLLKLEPDGKGALYLKIANPDEDARDYQFDLSELFAGKVKLPVAD